MAFMEAAHGRYKTYGQVLFPKRLRNSFISEMEETSFKTRVLVSIIDLFKLALF